VSILSCLDQAPPAPQDLILGDGLFNIIAAMVFFSIALVAMCSPVIRRAYRTRVVRLMGLDQVQPRPSSWWKNNLARTSAAASAVTSSAQSAAEIQARANNWEKQVARATIAAWLAFVLGAWPLALWVSPESSPLEQADFVIGAGFLALIPMFANMPPRWKRRAFIISAAAGLVLLIGLEYVTAVAESQHAGGADEESSVWEDLLSALLVFGLLYTVFHRRLRGLVFPVSVVLTVIILAFTIPLALIEEHLGACMASADPAFSGTSSAQQFWSGALGLGGASLALIGLWLGFLSVGALARFVERGWLSELSMVALIGLGLVAVGMVFGAVEDTADSYSLWLAWAPLLWLSVPVVVYLKVLGRRPDAGPGRDLLVLRVFSRDKKKQAFLDQVQSRWRYIGAVNLAGGPDMVDLNIDPYECAMFLSSRLHELYLPQAIDAQSLAARFTKLPDREGRYRINEMFNFNTAWRENVEQLILLSNTILLDVRGLTAEREGTSFEIGLLARHGILDRVVAVGDDQTDWQHVDQQLRRDGQSLEQLKRVEISKNIDILLTELLNLNNHSSKSASPQLEPGWRPG